MPLTTLDPKTAVIIIDLQKGIVALPTVHPTAHVISRSRVLADAFRARGLPVVLVPAEPNSRGTPDHSPTDGRTSFLNSTGSPTISR